MKVNLLLSFRNGGRCIVFTLAFVFALTSVNALAQLNKPGVLPYAASPAAPGALLDPLVAFPDGLIGLSSASPAALYSVDTTNGAAAPLVDTNGSSSLVGLSFLAGTLYGSDLISYPGSSGGFDIGSIDDTGTITFLSNQNGSSNWHGLASGEAEGRMWSIDINNGDSLTEQFPDGTVNVVGPSSIDGRGMAYDDGNSILYATGGNGLYTVNTATGVSTLVGPMDISTDGNVGLAFDECSGTLYMTAGSVTSLYTLDTSTGSASLVGPTGSTRLDGLAWNGTCEQFDKEIVAGNDIDGQDGIDLAVEVGIQEPASYDFKINYNQPDLPPVQIEDAVPAEWQVVGLVDDSLNCEFAGANKKDNGKSATLLTCLPESTEGMVTVQVDARCHGNKRNTKCKPTSCGALYLNDGAAAYELDPDTGEPVVDDEGNRLPPLLETNSLCLVAVSDLNGDGIDYSGNGDEDGDEMPDWFEACEIGTDPCDPDSDDDGYDDYIDDCPLEGPADPELGEILESDGCIRQSECSDGLDNDDNDLIDFAGGDPSCDDILDDKESVDFYYPFGPQTNVDEGDLVGWTLCDISLYESDTGDDLPAILTACDKDNLMLACRETGSSTIQLLAAAPAVDVLTDTGTGNTPHNANGTGWYFNGDFSWGFALEGDPISLNECDTENTNPELRLCWHTIQSFTVGGWRCGVNTGLNDSTAYEKLIYHAD